jgi:hypothetical protein
VVGKAVFVVTHRPPTDWPYPDAPFTFVTDGLHSALAQAQATAGNRDVSITPGSIAGQAFTAGLINEVRIDLYPSCSAPASGSSATTADPRSCSRIPNIVQGDRVTHLHYRIRST